MASRADEKRLAEDLTALLRPAFPGIGVDVGRDARWPRPCVTFRWAGFEGLLPEERFSRLAQVIPEDFRAERMSGCVWLELAPGESVTEFLLQPRSEDVAGKEGEIYGKLAKGGFFPALAAALGPSPAKACAGGLALTARVLAEKGFSTEATRDAKLALIRNGALCDCHVLNTAQPTLARLHPGAV